MSYHHFTTEERENLLVALTKNLSVREIARQLHRSPSSVSREIKRNTQNGKYRPSQSSKLYKKRRKNCRRKKLLDNPQLSQIVQELLQVEQWSPEQISNILRITEIAQISFTTIYRAIHGGIMEKVKRKKKKRERYPLEKFLRHKGRPYKKVRKTAAESGFLTLLRSFRKNPGIVLSWAIGKSTVSKGKRVEAAL